MTKLPDHLRQSSLGEEIGIIHSYRKHRKEYTIPQVNGIMDSTDSPSWTQDSLDLTVSPVKHIHTKTDKGNKKTDTNDNDEDEIKCNKEKTPKRYARDKNAKLNSKINDADKNAKLNSKKNDADKTTKLNSKTMMKIRMNIIHRYQ